MSAPSSAIAPNPRLAVGLILGACAFVAGTMLAAKLLGSDRLGPPLHPLQISQGRFLFALIAISSAAAVMRPRLSRPNLPLHIGRTVCGAAGVTLMFAAVARIPMTDATAITFLNPVMAMLLAIPLLGERVGPIRWGAAVVALIGAAVLLRPGPGTFQPAALLALAAAVVMGLELIFIKFLSGRERPFQILLVNNTLGLILVTGAASFVWQPATGAQWLCLAVLGGLMAMAQALYVNAMARADASFVTPFSYLTLIFAALYDGAVFGTVPDAISWAGSALIIVAALVLALREGRARSA